MAKRLILTDFPALFFLLGTGKHDLHGIKQKNKKLAKKIAKIAKNN
jgi:hypothetical protein